MQERVRVGRVLGPEYYPRMVSGTLNPTTWELGLLRVHDVFAGTCKTFVIRAKAIHEARHAGSADDAVDDSAKSRRDTRFPVVPSRKCPYP